MDENEYRQYRERMVEQQLQGRGIRDERVLEAMRSVPRHRFVPEQERVHAYVDSPLPIGHAQTISQPYMVAIMLEALELTGEERVLEVGTGSGYQAALLGRLAKRVYSVEIIPELSQTAGQVLRLLGYDNVEVLIANGGVGWKDEAPYDAIVVTAACPRVPEPLLEQLQDGGRLVLPVGDLLGQNLLRIRKRAEQTVTEDLGTCSFVPLVGEKGWETKTSWYH